MDKIDVLGYRPERHDAFTRELLAETKDKELQKIVKKAAEELSSPMALVSLVLDQIQFFKAFVGIPQALEAARGTHRDASFCQFVVRDGEPFEVNDAPNDPRIPQHVVKEYNVQAYLGVPVLVEDIVVGSLCVLDTKKRGFSENDRKSLYKLAELVNKRLDAITNKRRQMRLQLTESALQPGLIELSEAIKPIQNNIHAGYSAVAAIRSFFDLVKHEIAGKTEISEAFRLSFDSAIQANQKHEQLLCDIEICTADGGDCINAMEQLVLLAGSSRLSEIVISAQDLARSATKLVGGFPLPDFYSDPIILTKGNLAIAIVTNCLLAIAAELRELESKNVILLRIVEQDDSVELYFSAENFTIQAGKAALKQLIAQLGSEPSVSIDLVGNELRVTFKSINP
jgi:hypothetical protein